MEVEEVYSSSQLDRKEGEAINSFIASHQEVIPDPDRWLDEELERNVLLTSVDAVLN